ncbi:MAG: hypothetical protein ACD_46C00631G0001 [uncultured bacterium]|nr:MAG: hypothetical protein ACD_46C00631G0001 [uncultured bacterium]
MKKIYKRNLVGFLIMSLIITIVIILINYYGDGGYQFYRSKSFEKRLSQALLGNKKVLVCSNYNDRNVKKLLLKNNFQQHDILALGSSRTMLIQDNIFSSSHFFNASVTSASLEDDLSIFFLYQKHGVMPKKIFIGLDPWLVSKNVNKNLWKISFLHEYYHANQLFFGEKNILTHYKNVFGFFEKYKPLLSPTYLRESIKKIRFLLFSNQHSDIIVNPTQDQISNSPACYLHLPDGTRLTSQEEESTSPEQADYAGSVETHQFSPDSVEFSKKNKKMFEEFIGYLNQQGIEVIFYLPPYEPAVYAEIQRNSNYKMIKSTEKYFRLTASKYHIKVVGSYNPFVLGLKSEDFIDDIHLKKQGIDKFLKKELNA